MSIAVSAVVKPSRLLLLLTVGMCLLVFVIGALIAFNLLGELNPPISQGLGSGCMILALLAGFYAVHDRKTQLIDISGHGQIRLTEYKASAAPSVHAVTGEGSVVCCVSIAANSTLWPALLLLRLQTDDQRIIVLPVLPDSVEEGGFRPLALACRWIAAHNHSTTQTHDEEKITS
jgi:toxin CptA